MRTKYCFTRLFYTYGSCRFLPFFLFCVWKLGCVVSCFCWLLSTPFCKSNNGIPALTHSHTRSMHISICVWGQHLPQLRVTFPLLQRLPALREFQLWTLLPRPLLLRFPKSPLPYHFISFYFSAFCDQLKENSRGGCQVAPAATVICAPNCIFQMNKAHLHFPIKSVGGHGNWQKTEREQRGAGMWTWMWMSMRMQMQMRTKRMRMIPAATDAASSCRCIPSADCCWRICYTRRESATSSGSLTNTIRILPTQILKLFT